MPESSATFPGSHGEFRPRLEVSALTAFRVVFGIVMLAHGVNKVQGFAQFQQSLADFGIPAPNFLAYPAMLAEVAGGLFLIVGFATFVATVLVLINMLVAIFAVHLPNGFFADGGGFEYPLMLAACAVYFLVRGAGPISLDAVIALLMPRGEGEPARFSLRTLGQPA